MHILDYRMLSCVDGWKGKSRKFEDIVFGCKCICEGMQ